MRSILDEINPKTAALIAEKARAQGLSVDEYQTNFDGQSTITDCAVDSGRD
jgi:hypothetical protein